MSLVIKSLRSPLPEQSTSLCGVAGSPQGQGCVWLVRLSFSMAEPGNAAPCSRDLCVDAGSAASGTGAGAAGSEAGVVGSGTRTAGTTSGASPARKQQPRGSGGIRREQVGVGSGQGGVASGRGGVASGRLPRARARRRRAGSAHGRRMGPMGKRRDDALKDADTQVSPG